MSYKVYNIITILQYIYNSIVFSLQYYSINFQSYIKNFFFQDRWRIIQFYFISNLYAIYLFLLNFLPRKHIHYSYINLICILGQNICLCLIIFNHNNLNFKKIVTVRPSNHYIAKRYYVHIKFRYDTFKSDFLTDFYCTMVCHTVINVFSYRYIIQLYIGKQLKIP